ncbi:hypothetical protein BC629DRAFT_1448657 [Irpex lacteus]|nr:hypothetical protein BC629DRAFT_1448657 [Irpex lacteus]
MSGHRTAWSHKSSTLPSDRISSPRPSKQVAAKGKQKQTENAIPKSKEVLRLEGLRDGLASLGDGVPVTDPTAWLHSLNDNPARQHDLSKYTPICTHCGLILCTLNLPHCACPSCKSALLTPPARLSLLHTLEQSIADTLAREERQREEAAEEVRRAAGAFPTLAAANVNATGGGSTLDAHPVNQPHKVLSLNSKTRKVTVASYTQRALPPTSTALKTQQPMKEPEPVRVPRPPAEVPFVSKEPQFERPWYNGRPGGRPVHYIAKVEQSTGGEGSQSRRRRKGKGGKEKENDV